MMEPISVIVVTHKKGELLAKTLDSLAYSLAHSQLMTDDQLVVVDQGGEDGGVVEDWSDVIPPNNLVHHVTEDDGYKLNRNCNEGLRQAVHDRIVKIDGDMVLQDGCLDEMRSQIEPGKLVCGRVHWLKQDGREQHDNRFDYGTSALRSDLASEDTDGRPKYPGRVWPGLIGLHRQDILALGGFPERFDGGWGGDEGGLGWLYWYSGRQIVFSFDALAHHQHHPQNPLRKQQHRNLAELDRLKYELKNGRWPEPMEGVAACA